MRRIILAVCVIMLLLLATACRRNQGMSEEELYQQTIDTVLDVLGVPNPLEPATTEPSPPPPAEPDAPAEPNAPAQPNAPEPSVPTMPGGAQNFESIDLGLSLTVREFTFRSSGVMSHITERITKDGLLQRTGMIVSDWETIDIDVRSFVIRDSPFAILYIKNDHTLWGSGSNSNGLLGDGTGVDRAEPIHILDNVAAAYFAGRAAYAIKTDGTLLTWGDGNFSPIVLANNIVHFDTVWCNMAGTRAIFQTSAGYVYQIENDGSTTQLLPMSVLAVSGAFYIDANNVLMRRNYRRDNMGRWHFVDEEEIATDAKKLFNFAPPIAGGIPNTFFITSDGTLWGMGDNANGQLGDGTRVPRPEPVQIAENVVYARPYSFIQGDGTLWEWNLNDPTPQHTHDNVVLLGEGGSILFQDGRLLYRITGGTVRENDDVRVPHTLTFE